MAMNPVLTADTHATLHNAMRAGTHALSCSLDLGRSECEVELSEVGWRCHGERFPWIETCKPRTIYYWTGAAFAPAMRFSGSLIKLVPTQWGAPTFEIDGIKMLPTQQISPYLDAQRKVELIQPRGKAVLDTCGGLGYFAAWCLAGGAAQVISYEKNADVIWLRKLNPWSPAPGGALSLIEADVTQAVATMPTASVDAILHDPPRFGIAGELYSQTFYDALARVLKRNGRMFHYTGTPNKLTSGRDVPQEVAKRLQRAGFRTRMSGDGVFAVKG